MYKLLGEIVSVIVPACNTYTWDQEAASRTRAWKSLQDPSNLLNTTDARGKAICVELETQWKRRGSVPRVGGSLELALEGPNTNGGESHAEPKALGEYHAPTKLYPS